MITITDEQLKAAGFKRYWFGIWWAHNFRRAISNLVEALR